MEDTKNSSILNISQSTQELVEVSTNKRLWERKRKKVLWFLLLIFIVLALLFFILFLAYNAKYNNLLNSKLCTTIDCIDSANTLSQIMDKKQDPCKDFYKYACGNFGNSHPLPDGHFSRSWFEEGEDKLTRMVQNVLERPNDLETSDSLKKARILYGSCLNTDELEEKELEPLYDLLSKLELPKYPTIDSAEEFNLGKTLGLFQRYLNLDVIVSMGLDQGALSTGAPNTTYIIEFAPINGRGSARLTNDNFNLGTLQDYSDYQKWITQTIVKDFSSDDLSAVMTPQKSLMKRIMFMGTIMNLILDDLGIEEPETPGNNVTELIKNSIKILGFTAALNQVVDEVNDTEESTPMTLANLQGVLEDYSPTVHSGNKIKWDDYLTGVFGGEAGYWNYDFNNDFATISTLQAFKDLSLFLAKTQPITILRYIWWVAVREYGKYTTSDMRNAYNKLEEDLLGSVGRPSRERTCVMVVRRNLNLPLAKYVKDFFGLANDTSKVGEMLNDIQYEFENLAYSVSWMDHHTKLLNINKSKALRRFIGYESDLLNTKIVDLHYSELVVTENNYLLNMVALRSWETRRAFRILKQTNISVGGVLNDKTNPVQVNAYYARNTNAIYVPAGILQRPFYFRGLESLNYGAIGSILGHEVTHGFDSEGKDYDENGQLKEHIWSEEITKKYESKAQCFVHQYSTYNITKEKRLDGAFTLAENIADNGGLRESYYAYRTFEERHGTEPKLPGFEDFTPQQLLFLSFATVWCETSTEKYQELAAGLDNHSPNRIRVLATLQNMKEFSDAYHCSPGSFMNPKHKCIIW